MKSPRPGLLANAWQIPHPDHRRIVHGLLSVGAFVMVAKLIAAAKEVAVAARYGVSGTVDAYLLALTVVTWLPTIIVSVATTVLVPQLVRLRSGTDTGSRFQAELNGTALVIGGALTLAAGGLGPLLVTVISGSLRPDVQAMTRAMVVQLAPFGLLTLLAGILAVRLQSAERHGYALAEAAPAAGILAFLAFSAPDSGASPLLWGTLVGALAQVAWCAHMLPGGSTGLGGVALHHDSPQWRGVYSSLGIMALGSLVMGLVSPVDQFFAARVGEGAVAALGYANRIVALATGLGAVAIGRALLPVLSNTVAAGQIELGRAHALRWAWLMAGAGALATTIGWALAPWGVALLFERGSFTTGDTVVVSGILRAALLQLPFYFGGIVLVQWLAALRQFRALLYVAMAGLVVKVALNTLLIGVAGAAGIAWSTSAVYLVSFLIQLVLASRHGR